MAVDQQQPDAISGLIQQIGSAFLAGEITLPRRWLQARGADRDAVRALNDLIGTILLGYSLAPQLTQSIVLTLGTLGEDGELPAALIEQTYSQMYALGVVRSADELRAPSDTTED